jgi:adenosylcobyric acid synthase
VCGGFQMLGHRIEDPGGVESVTTEVAGLDWLPLVTRFSTEKTTRLRDGSGPSGDPVRGYEIRHGRTSPLAGWEEWLSLDEGGRPGHDDEIESACDRAASVYGTSLHGLFEEDRFRGDFLTGVAEVRGKAWRPSGAAFAEARQGQIDRVADACAAHLDLTALWRLLARGAP